MQNNNFSTLFVGQNLIKLSQVDSTNSFLKNLSSNSEPLPEGTVIMTDFQSNGRGQRHNTWVADANKNLLLSVLLYPSFLPIERQFDLNVAISMAVYQVLALRLPLGVSIKWPNDIYFEDKKIAGILIENSIQGTSFKSSVIGLGINVNQTLFPSELVTKASSLTQILQQDVDLNLLLGEICTQIERYYTQLKLNFVDELRVAYTERLYRRGIWAFYRSAAGEFEGVIEGVNEMGLLCVRDREDRLRTFGFKEIVYL